MATVKLYLDTRRIKKDFTFPIKLQINRGTRFFVTTRFSSTEKNWAGNEFAKTERNYKPKNIRLRELLNKVENLIFFLEEKGKLKRMTDQDLKAQIEATINDSPVAEKRFVDYMDDYMERSAKENTISLYGQTKNKILDFDPACTFDTMNLKWLEAFDKWMAGKGLKTNSRSIHFRNIRAVFNYAIDNEHTDLYPFRKFTIKKEETRKRSLTPEQLATLRDYPCEDYQIEYRDIFMLMFYLIGINGIDLFHLKKITNGRIEYKREKTGKLYSIKVEPEAMAIIERYRGKKYLLNIMERNGENYRNYMYAMARGLKKIGEMQIKGQGGKKVRENLVAPGISTYWARHTWATIAHKVGVPKDIISLALGHSFGVKVTDVYIDYDSEKIDEANRRVIDFVNQL